jgi:predicted RNA-binding Zn-ribbon protein involved in translation (DUF1610 family)
MGEEECPKCGAHFPTADAWAKSALSTLIAAPAVQDLATEVRCPKCGHVYFEREARHLRASWPSGLMILLALLAASVLVWAIY